MPEERVQRRLAAILAADVVGYSRLMEQNETRTLATLKERRRIVLAPLVARYQGRIVKVMGDGVLVELRAQSTLLVVPLPCRAEWRRPMRKNRTTGTSCFVSA